MDDIKKFIRYNSSASEEFADGSKVILSDDIESYIYDIYYEVNKAKDLLDNIKSINDLSNVNDCLEILQKISEKLY